MVLAENTIRSSYGLDNQGFRNLKTEYWNLTPSMIYQRAILNGESTIVENGPLLAFTGVHTGRSPKDKFFVREASSEDKIWWGTVNQEISPEKFDALFEKVLAYFEGRDVYVQDLYAGADAQYRLPVRIVTELAWQSLFARNMLLRTTPEQQASHMPEFTIIDAAKFQADPATDGTRSSTFIIVNLAKKVVLIGGTEYGGEIKKSVFTILNYLLPLRGVLPMHCSANYGNSKDDVALFFGLSGTGKTTLSADPNRTLIGDDEHGWSDNGVFNFEGGCYAKVIRLSRTGEPEIYSTTERFGTVLENVTIRPNHTLDLDDASVTENTRSAYPINFITNADLSGQGGHPKNIIFLTADAFGVLPPISRLTPQQAMYHFISGYTARVAGTEKGMGSQPEATFSACFGAPFLPLHPIEYAHLLHDKLEHHHAKVWLINTGWTGGPAGVGSRMKLAYTRAMVTAALNGSLDQVPTFTDPIFGLAIPESVPNVPNEVLNPRNTWANSDQYDEKAKHLAKLFHDNFEKYANKAGAELRSAGPTVY